MFPASSRALSHASRRIRCPTARRQYTTDYEKRTQETLKTSSRLTWLTTTAALAAGALYYGTSSSPSAATSSPSAASSNASSSSNSTPSQPQTSSDTSVRKPGHRHEAAYASDVPKPVEDRHGDTVSKHSIAAHKNQTKVRTGKFSGEEFDNHELEHTPGKPGGDFEKKK